MNGPQDIIAQYGFLIFPRAQALEEMKKLNPYGDPSLQPETDHERAALIARAEKLPGAYILFDPSDDAEGFLLAGDDREALARAVADNFELLDKDSPEFAATLDPPRT